MDLRIYRLMLTCFCLLMNWDWVSWVKVGRGYFRVMSVVGMIYLLRVDIPIGLIVGCLGYRKIPISEDTLAFS